MKLSKQNFVLLCFFVYISPSFALISKTAKNKKKNFELGRSAIECVYQYTTTTTIDTTLSLPIDSLIKDAHKLNGKITKSYQTILQTNVAASQFGDYYFYVKDSITHSNLTTQLSIDSLRGLDFRYGFAKIKFSYFETVIKDQRERIMTVVDRLGSNEYLYRENMDGHEWILLEDTLLICGYNCFKAVTLFRGRCWIAWYTPEIPISDGPWKLSGLPGLILKAEDTTGFHSFAASTIRKREHPFGLSPRNLHINISKDRFMKQKHKFESAESQTVEIPYEIMEKFVKTKEVGMEPYTVKRTTYRIGIYEPLELE